MADVPALPRPSQLWKQLSQDRKLQAADAFWRDKNAVAEQMEAVGAIAARIKFRVKSVVALPVEKKTRHLLSLAGVSELVAARLLVAYHLAHQRPMMAAFLNHLGLAHEDGIIADDGVETPSAEALAGAAKALAGAFPAADVSVYLSTLVWQDPDTWGALADLPEVAAPA